MVPGDDPRLFVEDIEYPAETGLMKAHFAMPKEAAKLPAVIVIHENRGLNPHTRDVARRVALEGFIAIAPDACSPLGGTPEDVNEARTKMRELDREATVKNYVAAVQYLKTHPKSTGKVGCTGFCWGGSMTNQVAVNSARLREGPQGRRHRTQDLRVRGGRPCLLQRHRFPLSQGGGCAGLETNDRVLQGEAEGMIFYICRCHSAPTSMTQGWQWLKKRL